MIFLYSWRSLVYSAVVSSVLLVGGGFAAGGSTPALSPQAHLGALIFTDTRLSEPQGMSCASCHDPGHAFQSINGSKIPAVAQGSRPGHFGNRKVPMIMYQAFAPAFGFYEESENGKTKLNAKGGQFWDGRADDLIAQVSVPLLDPEEMNNPSIAAIVDKVKTGPYADQMRQMFGPKVFDDPNEAMQKISQAVFAFETSTQFSPFSSKFDDYLRGTAQLSAQEKRGLALFIDRKRGNCIGCHEVHPESKDPQDWLFTDFTYDAVGLPRNKTIPLNVDPSHFDLGLCNRPGLDAVLPKQLNKASLCGAFKVPTLRNVALTAPYFHNGSIASLEDAVSFYFTRDTEPGRWYPTLPKGEVDKFSDLPSDYKANVNRDEVPYDRILGQKPYLKPSEVKDLVAFLKTLTDKDMH